MIRSVGKRDEFGEYVHRPPPRMFAPPQGRMVQLNGDPSGPQQQQQQIQQQQHQQAQQQQHQQQQQQQMQQGGPGTVSDGQSNSAGAQPEMNLANVLHYLQSEWRRWERDRNEWEIERAEMRARIALLEGQRRSAENLKVDLLRRVKMLEFALRQERTKTHSSAVGVSAARPVSTIAPSRLAAIQDEEKPDEGSGSSEGGDDDRPKMNGKAGTIALRAAPDTSAWKNIGGLPRDPKARARSREYLKQCLQEVTYLTSPGALNPLPPRPPVTIDEVLVNGDDADAGAVPHHPFAERPRKALEELPSKVNEASANIAPEKESIEPAPEAVLPTPPQAHSPSSSAPMPPNESSSPAPQTASLPDHDKEPRRMLTAIYRPDSKLAWREELRTANEAAEKAWDKTTSDDELASLTLTEEKIDEDAPVDRVWSTRRSLKSHLDIARCVAFAPHTSDLVVVTGGDDCTLKIWSIDTDSVMSSKPHGGPAEPEPIATYRGHTAGVTSIAISSSLNTIFTGSMDSTIMVWRMPSLDRDPYAPYDPDAEIQTMVGHTDVVWDVALLPVRPERSANGNGPKRVSNESRLVSVSADGTVKFWVEKDGKWSLTGNVVVGEGITPTCLSVDNHNFGQVYVGLSNGMTRLYDFDELRVVFEFGQDTIPAQVNAVLSHPTLPLLVVGQDDGYLRFYDIKSSSPVPTYSLLAHPAAITSLALSPLSPMCFLSASADCSVRLWDLQTKTSLQDLNGHRQRSDSGVISVATHPELPVIASAGADGVVRLWGAG